MEIRSAKDLDVYKLAYELAMEIFEESKSFPPEEKFSLTDQIRRSSRSVCACLREAWAKRRYEAHFVSKLTDSDGENNETDTWLDFARDSKYMSVAKHACLAQKCARVGQMLGGMMQAKDTFILTKDDRPRTSDPAMKIDVRDPRSAIRSPTSDLGPRTLL